MKAVNKVKALHLKAGAKPICDDCIAVQAKLSSRQVSNIISRVLIQTPHFDRKKDLCGSCDGLKYVMFATHDIQAQTYKPVTNIALLADIGFVSIGHWQDYDGKPELTLHSLQKASPALYAFVENDHVLYVGKTTQPLQRRLSFYQRPASTQKTNLRINGNLKDALFQGREIDMYGYSNSSPTKLGIFDVNLAAALEDSIITKLRPIWHIR